MARRARRRNDPSPNGIGEVLGAARRAMGVSLERAAADTHLRESYLAALERDDVEHLGLDPAYLRGTLRTYADYLGLDSAALVARQRAGTPAADEPAPAVERRPAARDVARFAVGVTGLALIAVIGFTLGETLALYTTRPASVEDSRGGSDAVRGPDVPDARAAVFPGRWHPGPSARPLELELEFVSSTWVRVETDGRTVLEGRGTRRSVEEFAADSRITVRVAKPAAVRPTFNGVRYALLVPKRYGPVKFTCDADDGCEVVK